MITIIDQNLLESPEQFIAHSCNCLTKNSAGTAKNIFNKYPYANTYVTRTQPSIPGNIDILGNGSSERWIINMYSQYYPGVPKYVNSQLDGVQIRKKYFYQCLLKISRISNLQSIAFPYKINCNLAGGDWNITFGQLKNFEKYVHNKFGTLIFLYCLNKEKL